MSAIRGLLLRDRLCIGRDGFLVGMLAITPVMAVLGRLIAFWLPLENASLYLAPLVASVSISSLGTLIGFRLIEEREQRTDLLLQVVPMPRELYFSYVVGGTALVSLGLGGIAAFVFGRPIVDLMGFFALMLAGALVSPLKCLAMVVLAENKIEGMAVGKLLDSAGVVPILAFFVPQEAHLLLAWNPQYWLYIGLLRAYATPEEFASVPLDAPLTDAVVCALAAAALCALGIAWLLRIHTRGQR